MKTKVITIKFNEEELELFQQKFNGLNTSISKKIKEILFSKNENSKKV